MSPAHEEHLEKIRSAMAEGLAAKYRRGQDEHGGELWRKPGMLREAKAEALDLFTYLHVAESQHAEARKMLGNAIIDRDWNLAARAYNILATGNPEGDSV